MKEEVLAIAQLFVVERRLEIFLVCLFQGVCLFVLRCVFCLCDPEKERK